jgi:SET domain-containing protein
MAERDIKAGEEIFVSYSKEYWDCIRYNIKHKLYKTKK